MQHCSPPTPLPYSPLTAVGQWRVSPAQQQTPATCMRSCLLGGIGSLSRLGAARICNLSKSQASLLRNSSTQSGLPTDCTRPMARHVCPMQRRGTHQRSPERPCLQAAVCISHSLLPKAMLFSNPHSPDYLLAAVGRRLVVYSLRSDGRLRRAGWAHVRTPIRALAADPASGLIASAEAEQGVVLWRLALDGTGLDTTAKPQARVSGHLSLTSACRPCVL
jgi:hypothetical protein